MRANKYAIIIATLLTGFSMLGQTKKDILTVIPGDSRMVTVINISDIAEKLRIPELKTLPFMKRGIKELKNAAGPDSTIVKKIYEDPKNYGLALEPCSYVFIQHEGNDHGKQRVGLITPIKGRGKFEKLMKSLLGEEYTDFLEKRKGYRYFTKATMGIGWTKKFLVVLNVDYGDTENIGDIFEQLFKGDENQSLKYNEDFKEFDFANEDIAYWIDAEALFSEALSLLDAFSSDLKALTSKNIAYGLSFDLGKLSFWGKQEGTKEYAAYMREIYARPLNQKFGDYFSEDEVIGFASVTFDAQAFWNMAKTEMPNLVDSLYTNIKEGIIKDYVGKDSNLVLLREQAASDSVEWEQMYTLYDSISTIEDSLIRVNLHLADTIIDTTLLKYDLERDDILKLISGDFFAALTGSLEIVDTFSTYEYIENEDGEFEYGQVEKTEKKKIPKFVALTTTALPDKINGFLTKMDSTGLLVDKSGYYQLTVSGSHAMYTGLNKDGVIAFSNDEDFMKGAFLSSGEESESATFKEKYVELTEGSPTYFQLDLPKAYEILEIDAGTADMMQIAVDRLKSAKFTSSLNEKGGLESSLDLNLSNENENALYQIMLLLNDYYQKFAP